MQPNLAQQQRRDLAESNKSGDSANGALPTTTCRLAFHERSAGARANSIDGGDSASRFRLEHPQTMKYTRYMVAVFMVQMQMSRRCKNSSMVLGYIVVF